ncbi:DUF1835 domain-containing protein [Bacillus tuaregi]|uniref:DUF1835 domain-containing protein n=1 Tax=Bacillus tuaregi TaxID=1816695 RepID=UPI0008F89CCD|nr:DUF1835 domain-containing protein [Bacillus tuaregi]
MIDELKRIVKHLPDDEVRTLLFQTFIRIQMLDETDRYSEEQFVVDLKRTYHDFLNFKRNQAERTGNSCKVVHILFGDSASGSMKRVLEEIERQNDEKVISFSDLFSIGPVWQLHTETGLKQRDEWLKNHLILDEDYLDEYQHHFYQTTTMINAIPNHTKIILWVGENAHEQTGLRYVLYLLRDKNNDIFIGFSERENPPRALARL